METKYLGYMNGWIETPEIVQKCHDLGHKPEHTKGHWRCDTHVHCPICGYSYDIDSSD